MSYAIAAYSIVLVTLAGYGIHLVRQRRALRRELEDPFEVDIS